MSLAKTYWVRVCAGGVPGVLEGGDLGIFTGGTQDLTNSPGDSFTH